MTIELYARLRRNALTLSCALIPLAAAPQEGAGPRQDDPPPLVAPDQQDELQQRIIELVQAVERRLGEIDRRLSDAGAGLAPLEAVGASGIDDLLRQATRESQQSIEDIDRILEIASQLNANQSSSGGQQSPQPQEGESPLDSERDRGPQERESTPSEPSPEPNGQDAKDQQEEPRPDQNPLHGENRPGSDRPSQGGGSASSADDANRWGELPVRYREVFRNQGGGELPVQYREWIDAYHRRLSKTRR